MWLDRLRGSQSRATDFAFARHCRREHAASQPQDMVHGPHVRSSRDGRLRVVARWFAVRWRRRRRRRGRWSRLFDWLGLGLRIELRRYVFGARLGRWLRLQWNGHRLRLECSRGELGGLFELRFVRFELWGPELELGLVQLGVWLVERLGLVERRLGLGWRNVVPGQPSERRQSDLSQLELTVCAGDRGRPHLDGMDERKRGMHHDIQQCHRVRRVVEQRRRLSGPSRPELSRQSELYLLRNDQGTIRRIEDRKRR